jgi:hypothetical protein
MRMKFLPIELIEDQLWPPLESLLPTPTSHNLQARPAAVSSVRQSAVWWTLDTAACARHRGHIYHVAFKYVG